MPIATPDIPLATIKRRAATPCWCRFTATLFLSALGSKQPLCAANLTCGIPHLRWSISRVG